MNYKQVLLTLFNDKEKSGERPETCIEIVGDEMTGDTGFLSYRRRVKVKKDGSTTHLFLKSSDRTRQDLGEMQEFSASFCPRECLFFGCLAPLLQRTADQFGLGCIGLPLVHHESVTPSGTLLVMEDLGEAGFQLAPPLMGVAELRCVLDSLARVQAAFWLTRTRLGGAAEGLFLGAHSPLSSAFESLTRPGENVDELLPSGLAAFRELLPGYLKDEKRKNVINAYLEDGFMEKAKQSHAARRNETEAVGVAHSDLWYNNCMIRRDTEDRPVESRLIDWQLFSIGPLASDLGLLWVSSADNSIAKEEFLSCVDFYYHTIRSTYELKSQQSFPVSLEQTRQQAIESLNLGIVFLVTFADCMPTMFDRLDNMFRNFADVIELFNL